MEPQPFVVCDDISHPSNHRWSQAREARLRLQSSRHGIWALPVARLIRHCLKWKRIIILSFCVGLSVKYAGKFSSHFFGSFYVVHIAGKTQSTHTRTQTHMFGMMPSVIAEAPVSPSTEEATASAHTETTTAGRVTVEGKTLRHRFAETSVVGSRRSGFNAAHTYTSGHRSSEKSLIGTTSNFHTIAHTNGHQSFENSLMSPKSSLAIIANVSGHLSSENIMTSITSGLLRTSDDVADMEQTKLKSSAMKMEVYKMDAVVRHHGRRVGGPEGNFVMFAISDRMYNWLKSDGEVFVQNAFHDSLDSVCRRDMTPEEAWKKAVVLDIGSNSGFYGLLALAHGCAVVFVEPQLECNALISQSIHTNKFDLGKVKRITQPIGRSSEAGKTLEVRPENHCEGRFPIINVESGHHDAFGSAKGKGGLRVPFLPVADMLRLAGLSENSTLQLIKIDTEGNEVQILEGFLEVPNISSWRIFNLVVEVTPMWWHHTSFSREQAADIFGNIARLGFTGTNIHNNVMKDEAAIRRYIKHASIFQDDLWLQWTRESERRRSRILYV